MGKKRTKVALMQRGSRHRYQIPTLLEKSGRLERFITDSYANSKLGRLACAVPEVFRSEGVSRLSNRRIEVIPKDKIFSNDFLILHDALNSKMHVKMGDFLKTRDGLHLKVLKKYGFGDANVFYSMNGENVSGITYASRLGLKTIVDVFIDPRNLRISSAEKQKYKLPLSSMEKEFAVLEEHYRRAYKAADLIMCPSQMVAEGVLDLLPGSANKIYICPYGTSIIQDKKIHADRVRGRLLWVGGDWIRKGLHVLAKAVSEVKLDYPEVEVRVAGLNKENVPSDFDFRNLTFLGRLSKADLREEYLKAQAFVFPTFAEGLAGAAIEAVTLGCPTITTREAGLDSLVPNDNFVLVRSGNSGELRDAILSMLTKRKLSNGLNEGRQKCEFYSPDEWGKRLVELVDFAADI